MCASGWVVESLCVHPPRVCIAGRLIEQIEHIESLDWFYAIPDGTLVALQSNDMPHDDHVHNHSTLDEFSNIFRLSDTVHVSSKDFIYPDWKFKRFMKIGVK